MKLVRLFAICLMTGGAAACSKNTDGNTVTLDPLAGLRYVNLVSDTGAMTFRVIDIVGDAPNTVAATFRTGGQPFGVVNLIATQPPYSPVRAGTRQIRVFMDGTTSAIASTIMFDTTVTFAANTNYTFYLYGTARTGVPGRCCSAMLTTDVVPTIPAGQFAVRVVNLAPSMAPTLATPTVDVFVDTLAAAATPVGAATFPAVGFGEVRPYVTRTARPSSPLPAPAGTPQLNYRSAFAASGTATPFIQASVPAGAVGTSVVNPIAGALNAGSAITIVLSPRSVAGSAAPQTAAFATPAATFLIDKQPARTAP